jgi:hypothetical protein
MAKSLNRDREFKEAIGEFIIAFSELEYGLVFLCTMTEFDLRNKDSHIIKYMSFSFEQKVRQLTDFIEEYLPELKHIWDKLKVEIGQLSRERRFLAHGFMDYYIPNESITTSVREKGQVTVKNQTLTEIRSYIKRLHILNTGENGINGEFHFLFTKTRVDKWNQLVNDENKIVYTINDKIVSEWKGESESEPKK